MLGILKLFIFNTANNRKIYIIYTKHFFVNIIFDKSDCFFILFFLNIHCKFQQYFVNS